MVSRILTRVEYVLVARRAPLLILAALLSADISRFLAFLILFKLSLVNVRVFAFVLLCGILSSKTSHLNLITVRKQVCEGASAV